MGGELELVIQQERSADFPGHLVLRLAGHATPSNHALLVDAFHHAIESIKVFTGADGGVILNLADLSTASSSSVGAMLTLSRDLRKMGRPLALAEVSTVFNQVLDLLRLQEAFTIFDTEADAHAGLAKIL